MTTLTFTARTTKAITITLAAGGGETVFELEANRFDDFASDESLLKTGLAAGAFVFDGLPSGTKFYFRARATNVAGAWSSTLMVATTDATPPGYTGYFIEPALLVVPEAMDQLTCAQAEAGSLPSNLTNDDPLSVLRATGAAIAIEFHTPGTFVDTFALLGTLANDDATWRIRGANTQAALTAAPLTDTGVVAFNTVAGLNGRRHYHAFRRLSTTFNYFWWRIDIAQVAPTFFARQLVFGKARQSVNYSRGHGVQPYDLGQFQRSQYGAPARVEGWRGREVDFQLNWLSEAEYQAKWSDLDAMVGNTCPVLALPNPKANLYLNDRIAYGIVSQQRGENIRDAKWSKELQIQSLY